MWARLFIAQLKSLSRNPGALFLVVLVPALYAVLFGLGARFTERPAKLGVVVLDDSPTARRLVADLRASDDFRVFRVSSEERMRQAFQAQQLDGILLVSDLSGGGAVTLVFDERAAERIVTTQARLRSFLEGFNLSLAGVTDRIVVSVRGLRGPPRPAFEYTIPSVVVFSVIIGALSLGLSRASRDRDRGVFKRFMVTPLSPKTYLASEMTARALAAAAQTVIVFAVGIVVYNVEATGELAWLIPLAIMGTLVFAAIGYVLSVFVDNAEVASAVGNGVGLLLIFMSGGLPQSLFSPRVGELVAYLPVKPMLEAMRAVVIDQASPLALAPKETAILTGWFVVTVLLVTGVFRFKAPARKT
jgi:ABC-2 type transport system permease protein